MNPSIEATSRGFRIKEMISKPKFRFRDHPPAKVYRRYGIYEGWEF